MAEVVKKYDFGSRPSGRQKYPWTQWMNGQIWALKQGTDFQVKTTSFANNAASYGKRHAEAGIKHVNVATEGDTVYLQAVLLPSGDTETVDE